MQCFTEAGVESFPSYDTSNRGLFQDEAMGTSECEIVTDAVRRAFVQLTNDAFVLTFRLSSSLLIRFQINLGKLLNDF